MQVMLPPLLRGEAVRGNVLRTAVERAREGIDPGLIVHDFDAGLLSACLVLAPELPLASAMAMVPAIANGFADAFGALAPAEVGCTFEWPGTIRINDGSCGRVRAAASTGDPAAEPDWLVIGFEIRFFEEGGGEPGLNPERTTLHEECCACIEPARLLEGWARHSLVWIDRWQEEGMRRLHESWRARMHPPGRTVLFELGGHKQAGRFVGLDEQGGMLLETGNGMQLLPLSRMLETV